MDITSSTRTQRMPDPTPDPAHGSGAAARTSVVVATSPADAAALDAVTAHHGALAAALTGHVEALLQAVRSDRWDRDEVGRARTQLVEFCDSQLLPHAAAEEQALYPAAAGDPRARLLVEAMVAEHRVLEGLVDDLRMSEDPIGTLTTGHALRVLFDVHLAKENELVLPLVAADPSVSLATILAGMHELLGDGPQAEVQRDVDAGGGCDGACGCGAHDEGGPVLDVRAVPHAIRHATVFGAMGAVPAGGSLVLVAPHDPLPLLAQLQDREPGALTVHYEQRGPEAWRLRLTRAR
jgi:uncharacterized protein (DUF2249 family)